jgi:iron(III) transport system ATP-binding protein
MKSEDTSRKPEMVSPAQRAPVLFAARLAFEHIACAFDDEVVLEDVSLTVEPGEVVCLLGPSGSGKTTLLRVASGVERPTAGRVLLNDDEVAGPNRFVAPEKRNIGLMFQDFALFPHLRIVDNVAFGLKSLPRESAQREARSILARVGLERHADSYPHILSGGEQQRAALARALAPRPAVILMDEPFSGLDVQLRESVQDETLKLLRETRATCLMVTHHPGEALRLADRIAVMRDGRLVQIGRAEELYHNPADLFVARLFSEINEIRVQVAGGRVHTPVGSFAVPDVLVEGEPAILCIRRRSIRFANPGAAQALAGRVLTTRFLGDLAMLEIGTQGFDQPLTMLVREEDARPRGSDVFIAVDPSGVLVFPAPREPDRPNEK